ncbi:MAG: response regulator [Planctomycetia bacterium]|nr:response regulator [Planctomycetia bacterium]
MPRNDSPPRVLQILLIDDNPADIELTRQCFLDSRTPNEVHCAMNAEVALAFLKRVGQFAQSPRPDLVLLDLNMPGTDGREILAAIKCDPELLTIPVVILTTSDADTDVDGAYRLRANSYLRKPADLNEFFAMADLVCTYWGHFVVLPPVDVK